MPSPESLAWLAKLEQKYAADQQDVNLYLEGAYHRRYVSYWDYVRLDTLLSLQAPLTNLPDEPIFIMYHQITELYFKLCLHEYEQIGFTDGIGAEKLLMRVRRVNRYFRHLTESFAVMREGMERAQFLQFRTTLAPASGFQSAQYRKIELASTPLGTLVGRERRADLGDAPTHAALMERLYWRAGAKVESTGAKALTLTRFEERYDAELTAWAARWQGHTLWEVYQRLPEADRTAPELLKEMKALDKQINWLWPNVHVKTAARYLADPEAAPHPGAAIGPDPEQATTAPPQPPTSPTGTGGTNWAKYLPPVHQRRIFFPALWTEQEVAAWGG